MRACEKKARGEEEWEKGKMSKSEQKLKTSVKDLIRKCKGDESRLDEIVDEIIENVREFDDSMMKSPMVRAALDAVEKSEGKNAEKGKDEPSNERRKMSKSLNDSLIMFKRRFKVATLTLWKDGDEWLKEITFNPTIIDGGLFSQTQELYPDMQSVETFLESIFRRLDKEGVTNVNLLYNHEKNGWFGYKNTFFFRCKFGSSGEGDES